MYCTDGLLSWGSRTSPRVIDTVAPFRRSPQHASADLTVIEAGRGVEALDPLRPLDRPLHDGRPGAGRGELGREVFPPRRDAARERLEHEHARLRPERAREEPDQALTRLGAALVQHEACSHEIPGPEPR